MFDTYAARSEHSNVPISTLVHRRHGRRSREEQAQSQQYPGTEEDKALVHFLLLLMSNLGQPVRIKFIRFLTFSIARQRSTKMQPIKPPGKNWPKAFAERHPALQARKVQSMDWKRHENNVYDKIVEWFIVIGQVLEDPNVLPENVYGSSGTGDYLRRAKSTKPTYMTLAAHCNGEECLQRRTPEKKFTPYVSKTTRPHRTSGVAAEMRSTSAVLQPDRLRDSSLVAHDTTCCLHHSTNA